MVDLCICSLVSHGARAVSRPLPSAVAGRHASIIIQLAPSPDLPQLDIFCTRACSALNLSLSQLSLSLSARDMLIQARPRKIELWFPLREGDQNSGS